MHEPANSRSRLFPPKRRGDGASNESHKMTMQMPDPGSRGSSLQVVRSIATSRPGLIAIAATVIGGGLALNWGGLVAIGAAPLILGILPCAAMCALGLCMPMGRGRKQETPAIDTTTLHEEPLVIEGTARAPLERSHSLPSS